MSERERQWATDGPSNEIEHPRRWPLVVVAIASIGLLLIVGAVFLLRWDRPRGNPA